MKRINSLLLTFGFLLVLSSMFLILCPGPVAAQPFWWLVTVTNTTGQTVNDFHGVFAGTGGTIAGAAMVTNPGGPATITGSMNTIDITWGPPGLAPGATFQFTFSTDHSPVDFADGYFTVDGQNVGTADAAIEETEAPPEHPTLAQWVLIVLALSVGGFFVWQLMRRKKAAASV